MRRSELLFERSPQSVATAPPEMRGLTRDEVRLLVSDAFRHEHAHFRDLPLFLPRGSVLVVNRSATLPASLAASSALGSFMLNLSTRYGEKLWLAEPRWSRELPGPLPLSAGEPFEAAGIRGRFLKPFPGLPRLWFVRFDGDIDTAMALEGEPIRYGYLAPPFPPLSAYQTIFATGPDPEWQMPLLGGSAEMPSAGRPFTPRVIADIRERGVAVLPIELDAGVSSLEVEIEEVERQVLYPEPFRVSAETAEAVNLARREGRKVIAVGTTVVRALETAWRDGDVRPLRGFTRLFIHPRRGIRVADALLTGLHDPLASHLALLYALAGQSLVREAYGEAVREGYLWHEFGDSHLLWRNDPYARSAGFQPAL
jgi:S-adenosylmethionine:tRNA ribosyltransferase-isomerase